MRDLKLTLYDLFGYFLPGTLGLASLLLCLWSIFFRSVPIPVKRVESQAILLFVFVAYFIGHLMQALGNLVLGRLWDPEKGILGGKDQGSTTSHIVKHARDRLGQLYGLDPKQIEARWMFALMDQADVQLGGRSEREIFQYREGFYRGATVGFGLLFLGLVLRLVVTGPAVRIDSVNYQLPLGPLYLAMIGSIAATWLSFRRFKRFGRYRVERALAAFIVLSGRVLQRKSKALKSPTEGGE